MSAAPPCTVLLVCSAAPYGSSRLRDALDAAMAFGAFEQLVSLLLTGDAVLLLKDGQQDSPGSRNLAKLAGALPDYGIERVHADAGALAERGLDPAALALPAEPVDDAEMARLIASHDVVLSV
jgi:tRNA 2-thiouridine synthesizing protein C